jgi:hypothetical protein
VEAAICLHRPLPTSTIIVKQKQAGEKSPNVDFKVIANTNLVTDVIFFM